MQLKRANVNGETPRPASAAAVEAVEARWRDEERKRRSAERAKTFKGCLSWLFLLLVIPGIAWYFAGEKVLPPKWTFPQVYERFVHPLIGGGAAKEEAKEDPADVATQEKRASIKAMIKLLEEICLEVPPVQSKKGMVERIKASVGYRTLEPVVIVDARCQDSMATVAKLEAKSAKIAARPEAKNRKFIDQVSEKDLAHKRSKVQEALAQCALARLKCLERTHFSLKSVSEKWTGPESRADAANMLVQLEAIYAKLLAKVKEEFPRALPANQPGRLGGK